MFTSAEKRFDQPRARSLGPAAYSPGKGPTYVMPGHTSSVFGTQASRDDLLHRDVSRSPFKDPTRLDNPSPAAYHRKENKEIKSDEQLSVDKYSVFQSVIPRDNLASVSKEAIQSPGPGTYIPQKPVDKQS